MDDNMSQQQREALKALEWIEHIIETESGAEADSALEVLREYVSRPVADNTLPAILHRLSHCTGGDIEYVIHYRCSACARWWSIGDGPTTGHIYCPWCGVKNILKSGDDE